MSEKIMIVDDDPSIVRLIQYFLERESYEIIIAGNGLQALKKAETEKPDLIMLDLMLPGVDGFEVCHRLRANPKTEDMPILMLSAKGDDTDKNEATKVGASAYFTKPFTGPVLIEQVQELLNPKAEAN